MAPTAMPALIAFGIFSLVAHWNDYFWPLIAVGEERLYTPPLGIAFLKLNGEGTAYGSLMAAATIVITPLVIAFLIAQRRFIEGITFTGLKGLNKNNQRRTDMQRLLRLGVATLAAAMVLGSGQVLAQTKTTINVQYPLGFIFDKVFAELSTDFQKQNPDIAVKLPAGLQGIRGRRGRPRSGSP